MLKIEPITPPEVVVEGGITATLTHKRTATRIDPADRDFPITITESKGWVREEDGNFQDYGPHKSYAMDRAGFAEFVKKTGGDCKLSDLRPAVEKHMADKAKAEADARTAAEAEAKAKQEAHEREMARQVADFQTKTTLNRAKAQPAGPDAVG